MVSNATSLQILNPEKDFDEIIKMNASFCLYISCDPIWHGLILCNNLSSEVSPGYYPADPCS